MATLADLLLKDLDPNFPVSTGNGRVDDPLIITDSHDYISVEYAVVRHMLGMIREEYQLCEQHLHDNDGCVIDELVFDVKPVGAGQWTGCRRFFFDITAGYRGSAA